jgi:hypothetical protein
VTANQLQRRNEELIQKQYLLQVRAPTSCVALGNGVFVCAGSAASFVPDFDLLVSYQGFFRNPMRIQSKRSFFSPRLYFFFTALFNDLIGTLFEPQQKISLLAWHEGGEAIIDLMSQKRNKAMDIK